MGLLNFFKPKPRKQLPEQMLELLKECRQIFSFIENPLNIPENINWNGAQGKLSELYKLSEEMKKLVNQEIPLTDSLDDIFFGKSEMFKSNFSSKWWDNLQQEILFFLNGSYSQGYTEKEVAQKWIDLRNSINRRILDLENWFEQNRVEKAA